MFLCPSWEVLIAFRSAWSFWTVPFKLNQLNKYVARLELCECVGQLQVPNCAAYSDTSCCALYQPKMLEHTIMPLGMQIRRTVWTTTLHYMRTDGPEFCKVVRLLIVCCAGISFNHKNPIAHTPALYFCCKFI